MFPIKYIDNNLVWNKDNEVFAYYELIPYNYSFLSAEQKFIVHDSFRQLIAQSREGKIHALQVATESSIRSMQEQSKKLVTGKLKEVAYQKIDEQTEALVSMIGDNQVDYRFFLGFKLMVTEEQLNLKNIKKSAWLTFKAVSYTHLDVYKRQAYIFPSNRYTYNWCRCLDFQEKRFKVKE